MILVKLNRDSECRELDGGTFPQQALVWMGHMARIIRYMIIVNSMVVFTNFLAVRASRLVSLVRTSALGGSRYSCQTVFPLSHYCSQVTHTAVSAPQTN